MRRDSVHGPFDGTIVVDEENNTITANGNLIQVIYAKSPSEVDYTQYGIDNALLVDNTGVWRDAEGLSQHLACPGVDRVVLAHPSPYGTDNSSMLYALESWGPARGRGVAVIDEAEFLRLVG